MMDKYRQSTSWVMLLDDCLGGLTPTCIPQADHQPKNLINYAMTSMLPNLSVVLCPQTDIALAKTYHILGVERFWYCQGHCTAHSAVGLIQWLHHHHDQSHWVLGQDLYATRLLPLMVAMTHRSIIRWEERRTIEPQEPSIVLMDRPDALMIPCQLAEWMRIDMCRIDLNPLDPNQYADLKQVRLVASLFDRLPVYDPTTIVHGSSYLAGLAARWSNHA